MNVELFCAMATPSFGSPDRFMLLPSANGSPIYSALELNRATPSPEIAAQPAATKPPEGNWDATAHD